MLLWMLLLPVAEVYVVELLAGQDAARLLPHLSSNRLFDTHEYNEYYAPSVLSCFE